jgi:D-alanyl-lipoteichoic acid acyltransferase DltB (MBOAT superfamily)
MSYRNLLLTMILGGLWHGAAWTFVLWGIFHGGLLIIHRLFTPHLRPFVRRSFLEKIWLAAKVVFMFQLTCLGWMVFRADSLKQLHRFWNALLFGPFTVTPFVKYAVFTIVFQLSFLPIIRVLQHRKDSACIFTHMPGLLRPAFVSVIAFSILALGEFGVVQFIYFKF